MKDTYVCETLCLSAALYYSECIYPVSRKLASMSIDIAADSSLDRALDIAAALDIDAAAANALFLEARTANSWSSAEITNNTLEAIYALTKMGPTAMNIQPLRITWVRSPEARERLVAHMNDGNKDKTRTAPLVAVLSYTNEWHQLLETTTPHMSALTSVFEADVDTRNHMALSNAHLQAGYFVVAARAAGLAVGPMTGFDAAGLTTEFHANAPLTAFMVINLGVSDGVAPRERLPRLDFDFATATL